jgi:hypothetical protein
MALAESVDVDGPREVGRRLEQMHPLLHEKCVRAQIDELLPFDELFGDQVDLRVDQRLASGDGHHRSAALIDRRHGLFDRHPLLQDVRRVLDLSAPGAGQVAGEERFELDEQWELLAPVQPLLEEIRAYPGLLSKRNRHC